MPNASIPATIAKYLGQRAPRYTSYPTAPHFTPAITATAYRRWLETLPEDATLSLYLHIPFCRKMCWYCGCNMQVINRHEPVTAYVETLLEEIASVARALGGSRRVRHIHFGGGTPNTLSARDLLHIDEGLRRAFDVDDDAEIAVELDPRTTAADLPRTLAAIGCTRVSIGVQDFDVGVQWAINRVQPVEMVRKLIDELRERDVEAVNLDLMYGLPHQTVQGLAQTIDTSVALRPDRFALFGYAHVPWMAKNQAMIDVEALPREEMRYLMGESAAKALNSNGYDRVGIDHFARPEDSLAHAAKAGTLRRNFQGYTADEGDILLGFGASAVSSLPQGYVQNAVRTDAYASAVSSTGFGTVKGRAVDRFDLACRAIIEAIMCQRPVNPARVAKDMSVSPSSLTDRPGLRALEEDGLIVWDRGTLVLSEAGKRLSRNVAAAFDCYLSTAEARHSKAV
jgi:oxygen-independent coproporphyrinogen-3 oxidase